MKRSNDSSVIYETFVVMCKILKEKGGIMNKSIAIDMDIDFSIFSKLLSGKRKINEIYKDKMYTFLKNDVFDKFEDELKASIIEIYEIDESSIAYKKMMEKNYIDLIQYLFYEFNDEELAVEDDLKSMFVYHVKKYFKDILTKRAEDCGGYRLVMDEHIHDLEKRLGLPENYVIEIGRLVHNQWENKMCILLCPPKWDNGREIFRNPDIIESADYYMMVRLKDTCTENLYAMGGIRKIMDTTAQIDTIYVGKLLRKAQLLAEMIFKRICENTKEYEQDA